MQTATAYEQCRQVTHQQARNFYYGIRLLPPAKRAAMCAVYALARRIDDIGDGSLPDHVKLDELASLAQRVRGLGGDSDDDPVLVALADACERFPIPADAFLDLIDGVTMDVSGRVYDSIEELVDYCRHVAGSIGRLSLGVFGSSGDGHAHADALGVALQLTNILRDVREDLLTGRSYLPTQDLDRFGVRLSLDGQGRVLPVEPLLELIRFEADRAEGYYAQGRELVPLLDRRSAACCAAMAGIYHRLLVRIREEPARVLAQRVSLSPWEKAAVAARSLAGRSQ